MAPRRRRLSAETATKRKRAKNKRKGSVPDHVVKSERAAAARGSHGASSPESNALAVAIVETTTQPLLVLHRNLTVQLVNSAFLETFRVGAQETKGVRLTDLGNGQWDIPELRELLSGTLSNREAVSGYRVEHDFETIGKRVMLLNARRLRHDSEELILLAIEDVTERERLLWQLEGMKEFAEKTIDAMRDPLLVLTWDLRVKTANQPFYDKFRVSPDETEGELIYRLGNGQWDIPQLRELLEDVLPQDNSFDDYVVEHTFETIGRRIMALNGRRLDHEMMILLAIEDVTERKEAEHRQHVLVGELQHRVKNILMNVRALARQSFVGAKDKEDFMKSLAGRLDVLARTQDLLVRSPSSAVSLEELIVLELDSVHAMERVDLSNCNHQIPAQLAQPMSIVVHELTTNASKYGALTREQGRIIVECRVDQDQTSRFLFFRWREHGVEIDKESLRKGFGTKIIEESLPYIMGGASNLTFHPDGVECTMRFPLA